ncbi:hypothetical protein CXB51_007486 [Gossypium anomalum]|uniref:Retrovirus-related Pol polyprotein from transposon TNT 1-94 n=1 Tax=Gossypium anomalum TaxID=47600 RepID=A0A8J6D607_9ROSI|nr:hypothetical protein CXB51_007486 [Gossypium anomalum]
MGPHARVAHMAQLTQTVWLTQQCGVDIPLFNISSSIVFRSFRVVHLDHCNGTLKYKISLLDRNTIFVLWQIKMQAVPAQMDLEDALLGIDKMSSTLTDEEKKRKDRKSLTQLHLHLSNEILQDVMKDKTAAALWKRLEQICMSKTLTSKLHMKQRLYAHRLEEGASVHEHLTVFKEILSNLEAMEVQYDKEDLGLILLCSLPPSYSTFRDTILYSRESLTVDEGEGLIVRVKQDRNADDDRGRTQERNPRAKNKIKREAANQKRKQLENSGEADVVENYSDGELLVTSVNNSKVSEEWILASGCTFHMSPNRDWFTTYETVSEGVVLMRNNASCKITGVGTIKVKMFYRVDRTLSDVRHVPELKRNLISLSTLDSKGYRYTAESGVLKISKGHMSENGMVELSKRGLLDGQGIYKLNFCEHCVFGKQKRVRFTRGIHNTKGTLEYIHSDLWGPSRPLLHFLINRSPSVAIEKKTPQEVWSGNPANYSDSKIFGCLAYAHVDNGKLEPRSIKYVFLGYKAGVKVYKLWCPEDRKVVISRDVVFDKTTMLPNLSLKDSSNKENQK